MRSSKAFFEYHSSLHSAASGTDGDALSNLADPIWKTSFVGEVIAWKPNSFWHCLERYSGGFYQLAVTDGTYLCSPRDVLKTQTITYAVPSDRYLKLPGTRLVGCAGLPPAIAFELPVGAMTAKAFGFRRALKLLATKWSSAPKPPATKPESTTPNSS